MPLRRVNQAYVIATSTKVDVSGVKLPATVTDKSFKGEQKRMAKGEEAFFAAKAAAPADIGAAKKEQQAAVDAGIKLDATLTAYLKDRFALSKGDKPHAMKF